MNVTNSVTKTQTKGTCDLSTSTALHTLDSLRRDITSVGYCSGDKIGKNETGGARSAYGGEERRIQDFGGET